MSTLELGHEPEHGADGPGPADAQTGTFDALGHRFSVASEDVRTIALVEEAFAVFAVCGPPSCWYHVRRHADSIEVGSKTTTLGVVTDRADVLSLLRVHVQRAAITAADGDLVLRAGGVELDGRTFVIGGETGCGVSTLVAALVGEGCSYMSDDAIPVEMRSGKVRAFPQPILLDDRSLDLLPEITALRSGREPCVRSTFRGDAAGEIAASQPWRVTSPSCCSLNATIQGSRCWSPSITTTPSCASPSTPTTSRGTSRMPSKRSTGWCGVRGRSPWWVVIPTPPRGPSSTPLAFVI